MRFAPTARSLPGVMVTAAKRMFLLQRPMLLPSPAVIITISHCVRTAPSLPGDRALKPTSPLSRQTSLPLPAVAITALPSAPIELSSPGDSIPAARPLSPPTPPTSLLSLPVTISASLSAPMALLSSGAHRSSLNQPTSTTSLPFPLAIPTPPLSALMAHSQPGVRITPATQPSHPMSGTLFRSPRRAVITISPFSALARLPAPFSLTTVPSSAVPTPPSWRNSSVRRP